MSFGRKAAVQDPEPETTATEEEQISTAEESIPLPWLCGERKIAIRWISRIYNQRASEAPIARPGKKG